MNELTNPKDIEKETSSAVQIQNDTYDKQLHNEVISSEEHDSSMHPSSPLSSKSLSRSSVECSNHETNPSNMTETTTQKYLPSSIQTAGSRAPDFEIDFLPHDPGNPKNWSVWKRSVTIAIMSYTTWVVSFYSSSYTAAIRGMMEEFGIASEAIATLGVTTYLLGWAVGFVVLAPMSEIYGRRLVYVISYGIFSILVLPCAVATTLQGIIVVRFFCACFGAAMISNSPGTIADISTERNRALALSIWAIGPINGPVTGPMLGSWVYQYLGWRWTNWLVLILAGIGWLLLLLVPETYAPKILKDRVLKTRRETGDERWGCRYDMNLSVVSTLTTNLSRPFVLAFTEPILWFWNLYMGFLYATLYLCFVAYPLIFTGFRGWDAGFSGLAFAGIGVGNLLAICCEPFIRRMINLHPKDPKTGRIPPEATVSAVCIAGLLVPIGQIWFAWTSMPVTIHWIWSILAGVPFGAGQTTMFIYANNYIAGSYGIYAASALAGNCVIRSIFGGVLPLAGPAMYRVLTPQWAGTLLGAIEFLLVPVPFAFYFRGRGLRERSRIIKKMRADQEQVEHVGRGLGKRESRHLYSEN